MLNEAGNTTKGRSLNEETACLTQALLERSGLTPDELTRLNLEVRNLTEALSRAWGWGEKKAHAILTLSKHQWRTRSRGVIKRSRTWVRLARA